jgi:O-antigen/teichoic acid export membrane protein/glycosyltransferase involved in cell wall biosynthesis
MIPWAFLTGGISNGLFHWAGHPEKRDDAFRSSWSLQGLIALLFLFAGFTFKTEIANWLKWNSLRTDLFVWAGFATLASTFFEDASVAAGSIWKGALFTSGFEASRNILIIGAALHFRTIDSVLWVYTLMMGAKAVLGVILGYQRGFQKPLFDREVWKAVIFYAAPVSVAAVLAVFSGFADQLTLSRILTDSQFAVYSLGCLSVPPLLIFEISVNRILIPNMSAAFNQSNSRRALELFRESISELGWILIPAALALSLFAKPIVLLLFKEKFLASVPYLRVYAFSYLYFLVPYDGVARARGNGNWILKILFIFSVISAAAVFFGVRTFGAMGALVGLTLTQFAMRFSSMISISKQEKWSLSEMIPWRDLSHFTILTVLALLAALGLKNRFENPIQWFFVAGAAFSAIYLVGTLPSFLRRRARTAQHPKVMMVTQYLGMGGLERVILNLAKGTVKAGNCIPVVFVYDSIEGAPTLHQDFKEIGVDVIDVQKQDGFSFKVVARIAYEVIKRKISVIHSHDLNALIYAVFAKWATFGAVRIVHTQHSFVHLGRSATQKYYERFFTYFADSACTVSDELRLQYKTVEVNPDRIQLVQNGVDFPEAPIVHLEELREARKKLIAEMSDREAAAKLLERIDWVWMLCMARIHPGKGQDHVLDLWNGLRSDSIPSSNKVALIFVGQETFPGALAKFREKMASVNNSKDVIYAGFTHKPSDWRLASDIFASGSEFEGMPLGPIEAMGAGLKLFLSDIPGHSVLASCSQLFSLSDKEAGVRSLGSLLETAGPANFEQARRFSWEQGRDVRERFGIDKMTRQYERQYFSLLER